ncbi:MAG: hypothetical protein B6D44_09095 [Ignavibacteriales bacterium UTCHB2]|jgi:hypothetical protein|nr:hypothetical protein [Candidatus Nomurabacteria bacterium]OQY72830.1 MAG: hypothetical protein B6D44_09095 [Ignavibacteriales bacterium UTCHB2]
MKNLEKQKEFNKDLAEQIFWLNEKLNCQIKIWTGTEMHLVREIEIEDVKGVVSFHIPVSNETGYEIRKPIASFEVLEEESCFRTHIDMNFHEIVERVKKVEDEASFVSSFHTQAFQELKKIVKEHLTNHYSK